MRWWFAILLVAGLAEAEPYAVAPAPGSRMALTVDKTGLMRGKHHLFVFERYQGTLDFDPAKPENSKIALTIDSRSAVCNDDWVSAGDLKKIQEAALEDMLAAERYPSMTFTSGTIKAAGADRYEAQGTLTIRGITKPTVVMVSLRAATEAELRLDGSATIKLSDYELKPPSAGLGLVGTKNVMTLNFSIVAKPK